MEPNSVESYCVIPSETNNRLVSTIISETEAGLILEENICEENAETDVGLEKTHDSERTVKVPIIGQILDSQEELLKYYTAYAKQEGFGITKRSCKNDLDGKLRYLTLACACQGKANSQTRNTLKRNPLTRTNCKAKLNATVFADGKFKVTGIELEHNHQLSPNKARFFRSNRRLDPEVKRRLELNDKADIRANKSISSFIVEAGGSEMVSFIEKDCRNFIDKVRRSRLGTGDCEALYNYFVKMQARNKNLYYVMDLDDECSLRNVFWADARSRAAYESFGDVVTFDTTYLTNAYKMPFAPFVGVNHHGQSILLGCGLILCEDTDSFVWLFKSWLACMSNRPPKAIITDQDRAMQNAIEIVFPDVQHRWCLWHVMKKIPEKLRGYAEYKSIKKALKKVVYDSLTCNEFEEQWQGLMERYNLYNDDWLSGLYKERRRWIPTFVKDSFWAGMSTTQRSESMNAFFDGYVNVHTTLKQFVEQYENALRNKVEKEKQADYNSFDKVHPLITHYNIEKQFQEAYTNDKFKEVQEEFRNKMYCYPTLFKEEQNMSMFKVAEEVKVGEVTKDVIFNVDFDDENYEVKCNCRLFEYRGILCRHALAVLTIMKKVQSLPASYILQRWRKDLKRKYSFVNNCYYDLLSDPQEKRRDQMLNCFNEVVDMGVDSDDKAQMVMLLTHEMKEKMHEYVSTCNQPPKKTWIASHICDDHFDGVQQVGIKLLNPIKALTKGQPPSKRKVSKVEAQVKRQKQRKDNGKQKKNSQIEENACTSDACQLFQNIGTQESSTVLSTGLIGFSTGDVSKDPKLY